MKAGAACSSEVLSAWLPSLSLLSGFLSDFSNFERDPKADGGFARGCSGRTAHAA